MSMTDLQRHRLSASISIFYAFDNQVFIGIIAIRNSQCRDAMHCVSIDTEYKNQFAPQSKNLSSIIRGYKSAVTIYARKNNIDFNWQPRFHDHIIRTMDDYYKISNYIINNPAKWIEDKFYTSISNDFLK
jgi:hypothetical protein